MGAARPSSTSAPANPASTNFLRVSSAFAGVVLSPSGKLAASTSHGRASPIGGTFLRVSSPASTTYKDRSLSPGFSGRVRHTTMSHSLYEPSPPASYLLVLPVRYPSATT